MTLVGGLGTVFGPVVGAFLIVAHGELSRAARPMGAGDPGRDLRRLRAGVPARHRRRTGQPAARAAVEHRTVSSVVLPARGDYATRKSTAIAATILPQAASQRRLPTFASFVARIRSRAEYSKAPISRTLLTLRLWLRHVGTARRSLRQYRAQMARAGRASAGAFRRALRIPAAGGITTPTAEFLDEMRKLMRVRDQWASASPACRRPDWARRRERFEDRPLRCRTARLPGTSAAPLSAGADALRRPLGALSTARTASAASVPRAAIPVCLLPQAICDHRCRALCSRP